MLAIPASKLHVYDCLQYGGDINYKICGRYNVENKSYNSPVICDVHAFPQSVSGDHDDDVV